MGVYNPVIAGLKHECTDLPSKILIRQDYS
jgi:hypothetical protein